MPRGRPKGSKNKPKTEGVPAPIGHNKGPRPEKPALSPDQERVLLIGNVSKIEALKEEMREVNSRLRHAYKAAKADGFEKRDIEEFIRIRDMDAGEYADEIARRHRYVVWAGKGDQLDLEDLLKRPERGPAWQRGFDAGARGDAASGGGYAGVERDEWMRGWHAADEARRSLIREVTEAELDEGDPFAASETLSDEEWERAAPADEGEEIADAAE